jgi:hypothetical protein
MPKRGGKGPIKTIARGMGKANSALGQITAVLDQQSQALQQIQAAGQSDNGTNQSDAKVLMSIKIQQAQLELQKDQVAFLKKISDSQNKQIEALQKSNKDWKTVGDKFKDMKRSLQDALDPDTIKKAMLGPFSMFKGARDKMERIDFTKQMRAQGDTRSSSELNKVAKQKQKDEKAALKAQDEIDRLKKMGVSERDIKRNKPELFTKRDASLKAADDARIVNPKEKSVKTVKGVEKPITPKGVFSGDQPSAKLSKTPSDEGKVAQSTTDILAEQQVKAEQDRENLRLMSIQTDLMQQIANNTAAMAGKRSSAAGGAEDSSGASGSANLGEFAKSMKGIGSALGGLGKGVGMAVGGVIGGIFQGIMTGLSDGIKAFANVKTVAGVAVLGLLTVVVWGLSKALDSFAALEWETLGKASATLTGLILAGAAAGTMAPLLGIGALALAGLGGAVWVIGGAMEMMGSGLERLVSGLERLQDIDGDKLIQVGEGLKNLGLAFAAFGAGQAAAGLGTLVGNLLTIGQDSPVEQLVKIGTAGEGVEKAGRGLTTLSGAMKEFAKVDSGAMKGVRDFPWEQATKFAAAGGAMQVAGAKVYSQSKGNADEKAKVEGKVGAAVVAPSTTTIQQNNNQTNVTKAPTRNPESSYNRYLMSRF